MKRILIAIVLLGALVAGGFWITRPKKTGSEIIVEMAKRGASESEMLKTARENHPYRLNADEVVNLKTAGVPSAVVVEMLHESPKTSDATGK